jgi:hypothetical protein
MEYNHSHQVMGENEDNIQSTAERYYSNGFNRAGHIRQPQREQITVQEPTHEFTYPCVICRIPAYSATWQPGNLATWQPGNEVCRSLSERQRSKKIRIQRAPKSH